MDCAYTYFMTNKPMGILYIGVTTDLASRAFAHRNGSGSHFCKKWGLTQLVHAERHANIHEAIVREKALKKWKRVWKLRLISEANPEWSDLYAQLNG
jgi:putative endonuclease